MRQSREQLEPLVAGGYFKCVEAPFCKDAQTAVGFFHAVPDDFRDGNLRKFVSRIFNLVQAGQPVTEQAFREDGFPEAFLLDVQARGAALSIEVEHASRRLREMSEKEREIAFGTDLLVELREGKISLAEYRKTRDEHIENQASIEPPVLLCLSANELMSRDLSRREHILCPFIRRKDLVMLHGKRGGGKSWVVGGIAVAVAAGAKFLRWEAPRPGKVLLVDGEMPGEALKDRLSLLVAACGADPGDNLQIVAADLQDRPMPNLAGSDGQKALDDHLDGVDLLILDNVSTLFNGVIENEAEGWEPVQGWLLELRRRGISVCLVHHSGKAGQQRGTSKREDILDVVIGLRKPDGYEPAEGARFEVHFEKARGIHGQDVNPFEARLGNDEQGFPAWSMKDLGALVHDRIVELAQEGLSQTDIAREVGRHKSQVSRILKAAKAEGKIE